MSKLFYSFEIDELRSKDQESSTQKSVTTK